MLESGMVEDELAAAVAALTGGDDERALARTVAAWDDLRHASLVPVIEALAQRVEPRAAVLGGRTTNDRWEAFRTVVERRRQAGLGRLVALLPHPAYARPP